MEHNVILQTPKSPNLPDGILRIWPDAYAETIAEAISEALVDVPEQVMVIMCEGHCVGITGYYFDSHPPAPLPTGERVAFLRWTGVLPQWQRQGIAREAINQLVDYLLTLDNAPTCLVESIPMTSHGLRQMAFFDAMQFKVFGTPFSIDWTEHKWQYMIKYFEEK